MVAVKGQAWLEKETSTEQREVLAKLATDLLTPVVPGVFPRKGRSN